MTREQLFEQIQAKRSFLCVGLDTDINMIPAHIRKELIDGDNKVDYSLIPKVLYYFNKAIIDATAPYAVAYKPNMAFYEAFADKGVTALILTCAYIKRKYPDILVIADSKRGDIGNTSSLYAKAFLGSPFFDAITLSPYMGRDTVEPFLEYEGKWAVVLALTSNKSADDFETLRLENGKQLYEQVLETAAAWGTPDNMMFVVGATRADMLGEVRRIVPEHFLLVPGVGAQGGSLDEVARYGMNRQCGLLVNSSRAIIYADPSERFAEAAAREARKTAEEMGALLDLCL